MVRAVVNGIDTPTLPRQQQAKTLVHGGEIDLREEPPRDAGLIGDDKDSDSEFVCLSDCLCGVRNELKLLRTGEKIYLSVQSAIAIQEKPNLFDLHEITVSEVLYKD